MGGNPQGAIDLVQMELNRPGPLKALRDIGRDWCRESASGLSQMPATLATGEEMSKWYNSAFYGTLLRTWYLQLLPPIGNQNKYIGMCLGCRIEEDMYSSSRRTAHLAALRRVLRSQRASSCAVAAGAPRCASMANSSPEAQLVPMGVLECQIGGITELQGRNSMKLPMPPL